MGKSWNSMGHGQPKPRRWLHCLMRAQVRGKHLRGQGLALKNITDMYAEQYHLHTIHMYINLYLILYTHFEHIFYIQTCMTYTYLRNVCIWSNMRIHVCWSKCACTGIDRHDITVLCFLQLALHSYSHFRHNSSIFEQIHHASMGTCCMLTIQGLRSYSK